MNQEELRKKLQKIVESIETIEPVADFDSDQWKKGNASLKLIGKSISSLNVNIKKNEYGVGIDGNNKGDILDFLKSNFKFNNENDQNERYKVKPEKIEEVVRYYAGVKQENMEKVLFCRITSMEYYQDIDGDTQEGGGSYTKDNLAHERFNFKIRDGIFKGFVQSSSKTGGMNLKKIDPIVNEDADSVNGVLVIFVADNNIVGYYKDATVYGSIQNNDNYDQGRYDAYNIKTQSKAVLLSPDSRDYEIPRGSGAMGQANTFYLYDDNGNEKQGKWMQEAVNYVQINKLVKSYIPKIIDYLNDNPDQIDELTSDNFGTTSYPLIKTTSEISKHDEGMENNQNTLNYRYWKDVYTIGGKEYRFHSQWGGHGIWNGRDNSISLDEKHRRSFMDYIKDKIKNREYWVISPNVNGNDETEKYKKIMVERQCVLMGWSTSNDLGARFNEKMQIGDLVLIAGRSNKNKEVFACGLVGSPSKDEEDYQVRYLQNFTELPKDNNLSFIDCTCGKSSQIKAIYQLHPNKNECDKKVITYLLEKINGMESMVNQKLQERINLLKHKKQIILQGSPGTGKTRFAKEMAYNLLMDGDVLSQDKEKRLEQWANFEKKDKGYKLIQFHPAYSYEDFVRGIVATTTDDGKVSYKVQNKVLAEMAENAFNNPDNNFVLIIDEINRANLSSVLGELIYALEYRGEVVESMYELDGSREIVLPENLYIIGTMNTADRSVGHIDYAIRRRFSFVDVNTDEGVIPKNAKSLFGEIKHLFNEYLSEEFELNDVMIGHSYFLADDLKQALKYEIKPILREYRKDGVLTCEKEQDKDKEKDKIEKLNVD